jgi:hypothetical protein
MSKQQISILQELELSIETIKSGLAMIQATKIHPPPIFLIFLTLSTGLERLFKVIIGMRLVSNGKSFPSKKDLQKKYGHSLLKLKNKILVKCYVGEKLMPPIVEEDFKFLKKDVLLNQFLKNLSIFALQDRYVYMNQISEENDEEENKPKWLSTHWEELTNMIVPAHNASVLELNNHLEKFKEIIADSLVACIEHLLGSLYRSITIGKMNGDANSASILLYDFGKLRDSELGTKKYEILGYSPL